MATETFTVSIQVPLGASKAEILTKLIRTACSLKDEMCNENKPLHRSIILLTSKAMNKPYMQTKRNLKIGSPQYNFTYNICKHILQHNPKIKFKDAITRIGSLRIVMEIHSKLLY